MKDYFEKFDEFFSSYDIEKNIQKRNKSIIINFNEVSTFDIDLAEFILDNPIEAIIASEAALNGKGKSLFVRFKDIPETQKINIRDIRSKDIGKLIYFDGIIRQSSDVRPQLSSATFTCSCGTRITISQDEEKFKKPAICSCGNKHFIITDKHFIDIQRIIVEESSEDLDGGSQPKRVSVILKNDLVEPKEMKKTTPGNKIRVIGYVQEVQKQSKFGGVSTLFDIQIQSNYIEPLQEDFYDITIQDEDIRQITEFSKKEDLYKTLTNSIAPTVLGLTEIKQALLFQLFGGVKKVLKDGTIFREMIHCFPKDTKITMADGTERDIQNIIIGDRVCCFNKYNLKHSIVEGILTKEDELIELETNDGNTLKITPDNKVLLYNNKWVKASDLKVGDLLLTPKFLTVDKERPLISSLLSNNTYIYKNKYYFRDKLDELAHGITLKEFFNNIPYSFIKRARCIGVLRKEYYDLIGLEYNDVLTISSSDTPEHTYRKIRTRNRITDEFFELLGMISTDGFNTGKQFGYCSKDKELVDRFIYCVKSQFYDIQIPKIRKIKNKEVYEIRISSSVICDIILKFLPRTKNEDYDIGKLLYDKNSIERFMCGVYNGDGTISKKHGSVVIASKYRCLSLKKLLLRLGIYSEIRYKNKLYIRDKYAMRFVEINGLLNRKSKLDYNHKYMKYKHINEIGDFICIKITNINKCPNEKVYDLQIREYNNFIANNIIVHNCLLVGDPGTAKSKLAMFISKTAPKVRYLAGKGSSACGMTASVIHDEFTKNYVLEAGALVLANNGEVILDEIDKMKEEDTSALHEALEQGVISISKANVQARLNCRTNLLACANPKFGRFDMYKSIGEQIDMPPALINRFDMIFILKDLPNDELDEKIAKHILTFGESSDVINREFFRKYIAYAKQKINPVMSQEAENVICNFYLSLRKARRDETQAVPISPRQLEALIRLSQASAKIRLSKIVEKEDAQRAIELLKFSLSQVGIDPKTGEMDIDMIQTGIPTSKRNKLNTLLRLVDELGCKSEGMVNVEELTNKLDKIMDRIECDELIAQLIKEGRMFSPKNGFVQRI